MPDVGVMTEVALTDAGWTALPQTALTDRLSLSIQNTTTQASCSGRGIVLLNYDNSAGATEGWKILPLGNKDIALTANQTVYGRMLSGSGTVIVDETA